MKNIIDKINNKISKELKFNLNHLYIVNNINNINIDNDKSKIIINLRKINSIKRINDFHKYINESISMGSYYVICGETLEQRKNRLSKQIPKGFKIFFRLLDFILNRFLPKLPFFKNLYFILTKGKRRVLSKAEILGRLISCGFQVVEYFEFDNLFYVISKKNNSSH